MSAQTHEAAPVVPLPEEMQSQERHLELVTNESVEARFASDIINTNEAMAAGEVPTVEQLDRMTATADVITDEEGKYNPIDGVELTAEAADTYIKNADPKSWILGEDSQKDLEGLVATERFSELTSDQKEVVKASKLDAMEPEAFALQRVKESAQKKLNLSEQLKAREAEYQKSEQAKRDADTDPAEKRGFKMADKEDLPKWAQLEKPENVPYKEWLAMNPIDRKTAVRANMTDAEKVADLIKVDSQGKARREDGKFLSKHEVEQIAAHEDQIRKGMKDRGEAPKVDDNKEAEAQPNLDRPADHILSDEEWARLSDDQKADLLKEYKEQQEADQTDADNNTEDTPVGPVKGLRNRALLRMTKAWTKLQEWNEKGKDYLTDEEKGSTRRKVAASVIGTIALAGIGYATYKGVTSGPKNTHGVENAAGGHASGHAAAGEAAHHLVQLHKGETVWGVAQHRLGEHATNEDILKETRRILNLNHISWNGARHLAVGKEIKV